MSSDGDDKRLIRIEIAPQEAVRFVKRILDRFMRRVLLIEDYGLTDESMLSDFQPLTDIALAKEPWDIREVFCDPEHWRCDVLRRTEDEFGVDIAPVFDRPLVEIARNIAERCPRSES